MGKVGCSDAGEPMTGTDPAIALRLRALARRAATHYQCAPCHAATHYRSALPPRSRAATHHRCAP